MTKQTRESASKLELTRWRLVSLDVMVIELQLLLMQL